MEILVCANVCTPRVQDMRICTTQSTTGMVISISVGACFVAVTIIRIKDFILATEVISSPHWWAVVTILHLIQNHFAKIDAIAACVVLLAILSSCVAMLLVVESGSVLPFNLKPFEVLDKILSFGREIKKSQRYLGKHRTAWIMF